MDETILRYNLLIRKEGKHFVAYVPTLGISDFGRTVEAAKLNVKAAIACHVEGLIKTGDDIPSPDTTDFYISPSEVTVSKHLKFAF